MLSVDSNTVEHTPGALEPAALDAALTAFRQNSYIHLPAIIDVETIDTLGEKMHDDLKCSTYGALSPDEHHQLAQTIALNGQADISSNFLACTDLILEPYQNKANVLNTKLDHNFNIYIHTFLTTEIQRFRTLPSP